MQDSISFMYFMDIFELSHRYICMQDLYIWNFKCLVIEFIFYDIFK